MPETPGRVSRLRLGGVEVIAHPGDDPVEGCPAGFVEFVACGGEDLP
ncbi:hypothetical protein QTQ03_29625 [Micromonospora sp. WMMA1363]|nr:hypothetical protein [Micromonospora sp. WMMA1363]MDM4723534.1 hypothetical protein [Micromonospora sp. WMMA1363]